MKRLLLVPIVLLAAVAALYAWAAYDFNPFDDWEEMYG